MAKSKKPAKKSPKTTKRAPRAAKPTITTKAALDSGAAPEREPTSFARRKGAKLVHRIDSTDNDTAHCGAPLGDNRITGTPKDSETRCPACFPAVAAPAKTPRAPKTRDPRIPAAGTLIARNYKGKHIEVLVRETDFEYEGTSYSSLSALATKLADGTPKNGLLWFGLNPKPAKPASETPLADEQHAAAQRVEKKRAARRTKTTRAGRDPETTEQGVDAPAAE